MNKNIICYSISFLFAFILVVVSASAACVTPANDSVYNTSVTFCTGTFNNVVRVQLLCQNCTIDFNGSVWAGPNSGRPFYVPASHFNVTWRDGTFKNYSSFFNWSVGGNQRGARTVYRNLTFLDMNISDTANFYPYNVTFSDNTIRSRWARLRIYRGYDTLIENNSFTCIGTCTGVGIGNAAVQVTDPRKITINANTFNGMELGVVLGGKDGYMDTISNNLFIGTDRGTSIQDVENTTIINNRYVNMTNGNDAYYQGIEFYNASYTVIMNNTITKGWGILGYCSKNVLIDGVTCNVGPDATPSNWQQNEPLFCVKVGVYFKGWNYCNSYYTISDSVLTPSNNITILNVVVNDTRILPLITEAAYNVTTDVTGTIYTIEWTNFLNEQKIYVPANFRATSKSGYTNWNTTALWDNPFYQSIGDNSYDDTNRRWFATNQTLVMGHAANNTRTFKATVTVQSPYYDYKNRTGQIQAQAQTNHTFNMTANEWFIWGDYTAPVNFTSTPANNSNLSSPFSTIWNATDAGVLSWIVNGVSSTSPKSLTFSEGANSIEYNVTDQSGNTGRWTIYFNVTGSIVTATPGSFSCTATDTALFALVGLAYVAGLLFFITRLITEGDGFAMIGSAIMVLIAVVLAPIAISAVHTVCIP